MVDLTAVVVCGVHPSVHAAYKALREQLPVSLTALYEKRFYIIAYGSDPGR
jgi:hypothetical protein